MHFKIGMRRAVFDYYFNRTGYSILFLHLEWVVVDNYYTKKYKYNYVNICISCNQITSRPCTFPETGSFEMRAKPRAIASAAIKLS